MHLIEFPTQDPPAVLAWEEACLQEVDETGGGPLLWFWEAKAPSVVVGFGQCVEREVDRSRCDSLGVPIHRRCSGGGAVLQGPGCLNFGVVLRWEPGGALGSITGANGHVMERQCRALASLLGEGVTVEGHTDLAWRGRKFSGNAQRRLRRALLFHGAFLHGLDLDLMERCLRAPSRSPDYRAGRSHGEFVVNLSVDPARLREAIAREWGADPAAGCLPTRRWERLWKDRYSRADWHRGR